MASRTKLTDAAAIEQYRVALENATGQPEIASIMQELGYDQAKIEEGGALLAQTRSAFDHNKIEDDETSAAYASFCSKKQQLEATFKLHRKKAKVVFRKDPVVAAKLQITGTMPRAYIKWLEAAKKFYAAASADAQIQEQIARLKITKTDLDDAAQQIQKLEAARALYLKEKSESQDATQAKDEAMAKMDDWMSEFYAVAKIALEDNPQLLEALGKTIKK